MVRSRRFFVDDGNQRYYGHWGWLAKLKRYFRWDAQAIEIDYFFQSPTLRELKRKLYDEDLSEVPARTLLALIPEDERLTAEDLAALEKEGT